MALAQIEADEEEMRKLERESGDGQVFISGRDDDPDLDDEVEDG